MKIDNSHHLQQGFSALGLVLVLLLLGFILLSGLNQSSLSWQKSMVYQKKYFYDFNQAMSAISWGTTQQWMPPSHEWQCKQERHLELDVCIKKSLLSKGDYTLVKGQSRQLKLYYLADFQVTATGGALSLVTGHWLDYCPEIRNADCD